MKEYQLKDQVTDEPLSPATSAETVYLPDGSNARTEFAALQTQLREKAKVTPTLTSGTQIATITTENAQGQAVETPLYAPQGGGGESGKQGVISQTQTWASDNRSYTLTDIVRGVIPQANIDLFLSAGALFNDTASPIERTAPWGEIVQHMPGYFYLNGLGDLTYEDMCNAWAVKLHTTMMGVFSGYFCRNTSLRTNFPFTKEPMVGNAEAVSSGKISHLVQLSNIEVIALCDTYRYQMTFSDYYYAFHTAKRLKAIVGTIKNTLTYNRDAFYANNNLQEVRIACNTALNFRDSSNLSNASILYAINNSGATSKVTFTLHADAYARAMADTEIQAALTTKTNVSLASA